MDWADKQKLDSKKVSWNAPKKADRPQDTPRSFKDLMSGTLGRHGMGRQVTAGMTVNRMNNFLKEQGGDLYANARVISLHFNELRIGITHRIWQEKVVPLESHLREIALELTDEEINFRYVLRANFDVV